MAFGSVILSVILIAADQWSKYLATTYLMGNGSIVVIPHLLGLRYIQNTGAAFSILSSSTGFLIAVTSVALVIMGYMVFFRKFGDAFENFCFLLIFSGGIGNLIDRVMNGFVVDYFEFLFMDFAIFNVADVYVCVGIGLYALYTIYTEYLRKGHVK